MEERKRSILPIIEEEEPLFCLSELFHENTKVRASQLLYQKQLSAREKQRQAALYQRISKAYKKYPPSRRVALPPVPDPPAGTLEAVIATRRSVRAFAAKPLAPEIISRLLTCAYGITGKALYPDGRQQPLRATPSGGALYPLELYPLLFGAQDIPSGLYHYDVQQHALELLRPGMLREAIYRICLFQELLNSCPLVIVIAAVFQRSTFKYGERGYRYVMLEAGHLAQNLYLAATALGLGAVTLGGFIDDALNELIGIDGVNETCVYLAAIGHPQAAQRGTP